jgi:hypothetical protein
MTGVERFCIIISRYPYSTGARAMAIKGKRLEAVAYIRTSSAANVGADKDSDKRQRAAIDGFAKRAGFAVIGEFSDPGVSGADPFEGTELDVSGFRPTAKTTPLRPDAIRQVSEAQNFPSRTPSRTLRRRRTGRNMQVSIKATRETIERLVAISDANRWPFGETLEHALDALEQKLAPKPRS